MYKQCQTTVAAKRQREMEHALLELMQKKCFEDISVSELCQYMQIPRRAFYRYFSDKEGALYALIDHTLVSFFEGLYKAKSSKGDPAGELDMMFVFWYENKGLLDGLQRSGMSGILVERVNEMVRNERIVPSVLKSASPQSQRLAMAFIVCGLMSMVLWWHHDGFAMSPQEVTQFTGTLLSNPLLKR